MKCLQCHSDVEQLDNAHLSECCGLTLQEYALRHHISLDLLVNESLVNQPDDSSCYALASATPSRRANSIMRALQCVDALQKTGGFVFLASDIRRLDELLWYLRDLQVFGFQFRQEYSYTPTSHRVVARNAIKTPAKFAGKFPRQNDSDQPGQNNSKLDFELFLAVIVAQAGELFSGYLFLTLPQTPPVAALLSRLASRHQIRFKNLGEGDRHKTSLYRSESLQDTQRLLTLVESNLKEIPCVSQRYFAELEQAIVTKALVFDAAHFITDHPGKCENLHGGRYTLNVKIKGNIDPLSGFVIDYGYLKSVVKRRVIERLDHQNLNFVCADLGWRSSTELLNIFIWEQLIDYLPGLIELQTYETTQSYCTYRGPSLEVFQNNKNCAPLKHFSQPELGRSLLRKLLKANDIRKTLKVIGS